MIETEILLERIKTLENALIKQKKQWWTYNTGCDFPEDCVREQLYRELKLGSLDD